MVCSQSAVCILYCPPIYTLRINKAWTYSFFFLNNTSSGKPGISNHKRNTPGIHPFNSDLKPLKCDTRFRITVQNTYSAYFYKILKHFKNYLIKISITLLKPWPRLYIVKCFVSVTLGDLGFLTLGRKTPQPSPPRPHLTDVFYYYSF